MNNIPVIDMTATGVNITRLRINAGLTVRDLQAIFGFSTPQAIYKWQRGDAMPALDNIVESSPTPQFKSINSSALSFLHSPTFTSIHDHWKNHSLIFG